MDRDKEYRGTGYSKRVETRHVSALTKATFALVLAGGRGSRLKQLTDWRAKPAVPFGGKFRIIGPRREDSILEVKPAAGGQQGDTDKDQPEREGSGEHLFSRKND